MLGLTIEDLQAMSQVDITTVERENLTDLRDISIDTSKPVIKKLEALVRQSQNIYVHNIGEYVVKVVHQKEGVSIDDKIAEHIRKMAEVYY